MKYSNLQEQSLKLIASKEDRIITLDADGMFDLHIWHNEGDVIHNGKRFKAIESIRPSRLFVLLQDNNLKLQTNE